MEKKALPYDCVSGKLQQQYLLTGVLERHGGFHVLAGSLKIGDGSDAEALMLDDAAHAKSVGSRYHGDRRANGRRNLPYLYRSQMGGLNGGRLFFRFESRTHEGPFCRGTVAICLHETRIDFIKEATRIPEFQLSRSSGYNAFRHA